MATPKHNKKGGGKGDGKGGKDGKGNKNPPYQLPGWFPTQDPASQFPMGNQATRDVRLTIHPQIEALNRLREQALAQYREQAQRSNSMFGQEQAALRPLGGQLAGASKAIMGQLGDILGSFGGTTGGNAAENAAAGNVQNAAARGSLGALAAGQQSDVAALKAALGGAAMQRQEMGTDIMAKRSDALDQLRSQKQDVFGQMPALIRQREDQLQQEAFDRALALSQAGLNRKSTLAGIQSNAALQKLMENNLTGLLGGGGGGGGGGANIPNSQNSPGRAGTPGGAGPGHGNLPLTGQDPQINPFQMFVTGSRGWNALNAQNQQAVRNKIMKYAGAHTGLPAFANLNLAHNRPTPGELIMALRNYYYGPHKRTRGGKQV